MDKKYNDFSRLGKHGYIGGISALDLIAAFNNKELLYVPEAQRGLKEEKNYATGKIESVPILYKKNVKEIKEAILADSFFPDTMTINVIGGDEYLKFDEKTKVLTISDKQAILDGYHRLTAIVELSSTKEGMKKIKDLVFPVKVTSVDMQEAKRQFYQFTLGSKISNSRAAFLNNANQASVISNRLYSDIDSPLNGKISTTSNTVTTSDKVNLVTFATLTNALEISFNTKSISNAIESEDIIDFLKKFFELLFEVIPEFKNFDDRKNLRLDDSLKCENFMFYGYVSIAAYIYNKGNVDILKSIKLIKEIDMNKEAEWLNDVRRTRVNYSEDKFGNKVEKINYQIVNNTTTRRTIAFVALKEYKKLIFI